MMKAQKGSIWNILIQVFIFIVNYQKKRNAINKENNDLALNQWIPIILVHQSS